MQCLRHCMGLSKSKRRSRRPYRRLCSSNNSFLFKKNVNIKLQINVGFPDRFARGPKGPASDSSAAVALIQLVPKYISRGKVMSRYFTLKQSNHPKMGAWAHIFQMQRFIGDRLIVLCVGEKTLRVSRRGLSGRLIRTNFYCTQVHLRWVCWPHSSTKAFWS